MYLELIGILLKSLWHALKKDKFIVQLKFSTTEDVGYAANVYFKDDLDIHFEVVTWVWEAMEMNYALAAFLKAAIINNAIRNKSAHITSIIIKKAV